ncbi:uncharacterized protein LOC110459509 isoform X2 [Mizuhopecten yessoensis]|uniref:uncharacterized protein LOC110459509 isoform X2 n=1 Tax=Mizuhopecten yessoensis TaxID=6573 RepID=UPI000B45EA4C|nr:uncharacterized protein LOC110459509 isoform X2 [Mizuhopecten yessoensis]
MGMADKRLTVNFGAQVLRSVKKSRTSVTRYRSDFSSKIDQLLVSSRQEKMSKLNLQHQQKMRATQESMQQLRETIHRIFLRRLLGCFSTISKQTGLSSRTESFLSHPYMA